MGKKQAKNKKIKICGAEFTPKEIEKSQQISNDIAEDIKNYDSMAELRTAVNYYTSLYCEESQKRASLEMKLELFKIAKKLMDNAISPESLD